MTKRLLLLLLASMPALADDAALLRCRAIQNATARLACYDALPVPGSESRAPAAPVAAPPRAEPRAEPRAAPRAPEPQAPAQFGLEQKPNPAELQAIESSIPGNFEGWYPNAVIRLANGQIWQISDGSTRRVYKNNPKVTIRRAMLGSFFLEIEGENNAPRVRRVQ
jgi:hypothetical protein